MRRLDTSRANARVALVPCVDIHKISQQATFRAWTVPFVPTGWLSERSTRRVRRLSWHVLATLLLVLVGQTAVMPQRANALSSAATACDVEPRPIEDFAAIDRGTPYAVAASLGTPIATPVPPEGGEPADAAITEEIEASVSQIVACTNAGDIRRGTALLTDALFQRTYGGSGSQLLAAFGTPTPLPPAQQWTQFAVSDVLVYPDGRVSAVLSKGNDRSLFVFVKQDGRYLVDSGYDLTSRATSP